MEIQDEYDAYRACLDAYKMAGGNLSGLAAEMWPDLVQATAEQRLMACTSPRRREKFDLAEIARLVNLSGCNAPLAFLSEGTHHRPPEPIPQEDDLIALQESVSAIADQLTTLSRRLERAMQIRDCEQSRRRRPRYSRGGLVESHADEVLRAVNLELARDGLEKLRG